MISRAGVKALNMAFRPNKRFEVVVYVDAPDLRTAKRALMETVENGYHSPLEYVRELAAGLAEVKPPKRIPAPADRSEKEATADA